MLWIESVGAVIPGGTPADFGRGLAINEWLRGASREQVVEGLRALPRCRSRSCARRTEQRQTVLRSSARSPDR